MNKQKEILMAYKELHLANDRFYGTKWDAGNAHAGGNGKFEFTNTALIQVQKELNSLRFN